MCVIIAQKPGGRTLEKKEFKLCENQNPHGMGLAYPDEGEVQIWRTMDDLDGFYELYRELDEMDLPILLHFRIATVGEINEKNTQPFYVNDKLAIGHNGTINISVKGDRSDTKEFTRRILGNLEDDWLENDAILELVHRYIGTGNFIALLNAETESFRIFNYSRGVEVDGTWYSNLLHLPRGWKTSFINGDHSIEALEERFRTSPRSNSEICDECYALGGHFSEECPNVEENESEDDVGVLIPDESREICQQGLWVDGEAVCYGCVKELGQTDEGAGGPMEVLYEDEIEDKTEFGCIFCGWPMSNKNPYNKEDN